MMNGASAGGKKGATGSMGMGAYGHANGGASGAMSSSKGAAGRKSESGRKSGGTDSSTYASVKRDDDGKPKLPQYGSYAQQQAMVAKEQRLK